MATSQGVDMMTAKLTNCLRAPGVTVRQAADAIKHLLHLHAEGARSTHHLDPVKLYLEAQVRLATADVYNHLLCKGIHLAFLAAMAGCQTAKRNNVWQTRTQYSKPAPFGAHLQVTSSTLAAQRLQEGFAIHTAPSLA